MYILTQHAPLVTKLLVACQSRMQIFIFHPYCFSPLYYHRHSLIAGIQNQAGIRETKGNRTINQLSTSLIQTGSTKFKTLFHDAVEHFQWWIYREIGKVYYTLKC